MRPDPASNPDDNLTSASVHRRMICQSCVSFSDVALKKSDEKFVRVVWGVHPIRDLREFKPHEQAGTAMRQGSEPHPRPRTSTVSHG